MGSWDASSRAQQVSLRTAECITTMAHCKTAAKSGRWKTPFDGFAPWLIRHLCHIQDTDCKVELMKGDYQEYGTSIDERDVLIILLGLNSSAPYYSAECLSLQSTQAKLCGDSPNSITIQKELKHNPCQSFEKHNQIPSMDHRGTQTHRVSRTKSTESETLARAIPHSSARKR